MLAANFLMSYLENKPEKVDVNDDGTQDVIINWYACAKLAFNMRFILTVFWLFIFYHWANHGVALLI